MLLYLFIFLLYFFKNQHYTLTPLDKSRQRPRVSSRRYVSDIDENSLYNNRLKSRQVRGDKLKLVEIGSPLGESAARRSKRVYSYYEKEPEGEELSKIRKNVSKLEYQILKRKYRFKGKLAEILPNNRMRIRTLTQQLEIPQETPTSGEERLNKDRNVCGCKVKIWVRR